MTREKINLVIKMFFILLFINCSKNEIIYLKKTNEKVFYQKVDINELLDNLEKYDNKYIEVYSVFQMDIENVYIGYDVIDRRIWLDFNQYKPLKKANLKLIDDELFQHRKRKVKVKGLLKTSISGHLGYKAGLTEISEFIVNPKQK